MDTMTAVLIILSLALVGLGVVLIASKQANGSTKGNNKKSRAARMKEGNRRLNKNPKDMTGLKMVGEVHFQEQNWERAFAIYSVLVGLVKEMSTQEQLTVYIRYGMASLKTKHYADAKKGFLLARTIDLQNFDVNANLGYLLYLQEDYEKAIPFLRKALIVKKEHLPSIRYLGYSLQKSRKYNEAFSYLKQIVTIEPDNKDVLFAMAICLLETGRNEQALKVFTRLRVDPNIGAKACLYCGIIHEKMNKLEEAQDDFILGMKHQNIDSTLLIEIQYYLAKIYIKEEKLGEALKLLHEIETTHPGFKDTTMLIARYQELSQNQHLHTYMMGGQSRFIALCRRMVNTFYKDARVKITDVAVQATYTDIVAEIDTPRWTDIAVFRFFRSQGSVGELLLRDFHGRVKDLRGGTGICVTAGIFSDEAKRFAEGRPINLYDKTALSKVLKALH